MAISTVSIAKRTPVARQTASFFPIGNFDQTGLGGKPAFVYVGRSGDAAEIAEQERDGDG
jgi:hypothetical protein